MVKNILKGEYDFIFGAGEACACSSALRSNGLQFESYPLDWLYGGDFRTRTDLIISGFRDFINQKDLVKVGEREHPLPCDIYQNQRNKIVFNHDFALHQELDKTYPAVKEKYDRRIKRLYANIDQAKDILIVYISTPSKKVKIRKTIPLIKECFKDIQNKFPDKNIKLLYLGHKKWRLPITLKWKLSKDVLFLVTNYRNRDKNTEPFVVEDKVLVKILKHIRLNKNVIKNHEPKSWVMQ